MNNVNFSLRLCELTEQRQSNSGYAYGHRGIYHHIVITSFHHETWMYIRNRTG